MTGSSVTIGRTTRTTGGAAKAAPPERFTARARRRRSQLVAWAFLLPVVAFLVVFYAFPLARNIELSLRDYTVRSFVFGDAPWVGFANYLQVFEDSTFAPAVWHTAVFVLASIAVQFSVGLALAVFFYRHFPLSTVLRALFLLPWLLPLIVSASTWSWMLDSESGVVNAVLGAVGIGNIHWLTAPGWALASVTIANIWLGIPFNLVILYSGLQNISGDLYEAAALDGANGWQTFWRVIFPLLRPVSAITLLLGLVYTLKVIDIIWVMTRGGPGDASTTLATWSYELGFGTALPQFSTGAAVGNVLIVIALVFGLIYVRVQRSLEQS
jgi:multiple sugar transport system permease protein